MRAFLRAVPAKPKEPADFAAARERWHAASARRRELVDRHAGAQAALGQLGRGEDDPPLAPRLAEAAERYLQGREPSERRLRREVEDLEEELAALTPRHAAEAGLWREALASEATRRVEELRPRHRAVVARIAAAVQALSDALEDERALHREITTAGLGGHASLPDAAYPLGGSLHQYDSALSQWSRRARELGLL